MAEPAPALPAIRQVTAADRDAAVARLSSAFADDAIEMEELERRTAAVFHATTVAELQALLADLPAPGAGTAVDTSASRRALLLAPSLSRVTALLANVERGGVVEVPARLEVRAFFADVQLDLSRARFTAPLTEIAVRTVGSNVQLRLPAGAIVENRGSGMLASFACRAGAPRIDGRNDAPVVRIVVTGRALLGNVEIETASRAWVLATRRD